MMFPLLVVPNCITNICPGWTGSTGLLAKKYMGHWVMVPEKSFLWYLVNLCIANAYIVYKEVSTRQTKANYDHMAFRLELAQELIAKFNGRKRAIQDQGGGYTATSQFLRPLFGAQ